MQLRKVLITGGTSGIGYSTALKFASEGFKTIITGRNEEIGKKLENEAENIVFIKADLSRRDELDRLVTRSYEVLGSIDILINNAGVLILNPLEKMSLEDFEYTYRVNVYAPFYLMKKIIPRMAEDGGGVVINVSSIAGVSPYPKGVAYCSSKAALISITKSIALEYASKNVRVNVVAPGLVKTRMAIESLGGEDAVVKAANNIPLKYVAEPDEIAELIFYLASDRARYITGSVFIIDGGVTAGRYRSLVEE